MIQLHIKRCYSPSSSEFVRKTSFSELVAKKTPAVLIKPEKPHFLVFIILTGLVNDVAFIP